MSEELRPCPWCGKVPPPGYLGSKGNKVYCERADCPRNSWSVEDAIKNWNTRPIEDALRAEIAELKARSERLISVDELTVLADKFEKEDL